MNQLIKKAMKKDADAFTELMEQNMQSMYKTAWVYLKNDMDIADAIQDTILACYENLDTLRNPKYFKTWMTKILMNLALDSIQKVDFLELDEGMMKHLCRHGQSGKRCEGESEAVIMFHFTA